MHDFSDWMINSRFFYPLPAIERLVTHVYNGKEKACAFTICNLLYCLSCQILLSTCAVLSKKAPNY